MTHTCTGEEYFDYMLFSVNDERVHHTQSWWTTGMVQRRFGYNFSVSQCVAVCCGVLRCVAVCCGVPQWLQCVAVWA